MNSVEIGLTSQGREGENQRDSRDGLAFSTPATPANLPAITTFHGSLL